MISKTAVMSSIFRNNLLELDVISVDVPLMRQLSLFRSLRDEGASLKNQTIISLQSQNHFCLQINPS